MTPGIVIPIILLLIAVSFGFRWARGLKAGASAPVEAAPPPSARLTSNALRELPSPPWRVVYEVSADKLGGIEHVLIGPPGVFAMQTSMEPLPQPSEPDPRAIGRAAIARGPLDDALRRCAMSSDSLVTVHWGIDQQATRGPSLEVVPGQLAVDGRRIDEWCRSLPAALTPAQVDLAWQTVLTSIGRPDPLA